MHGALPQRKLSWLGYCLAGSLYFSLFHNVQTESERCFRGVKEAVAWSWPLTSIEFQGQKCWSFTSPHPYVFMVWFLIKLRNKFSPSFLLRRMLWHHTECNITFLMYSILLQDTVFVTGNISLNTVSLFYVFDKATSIHVSLINCIVFLQTCIPFRLLNNKLTLLRNLCSLFFTLCKWPQYPHVPVNFRLPLQHPSATRNCKLHKGMVTVHFLLFS
jgi:hypothetical protein